MLLGSPWQPICSRSYLKKNTCWSLITMQETISFHSKPADTELVKGLCLMLVKEKVRI